MDAGHLGRHVRRAVGRPVLGEDHVDIGVDPGQFAVQYCAFIFGIVYQWLVNAQALDLDAVFESYTENILALLGNPDYKEEAAS